ncbi:MAG: 30S ribosomal protein S3 [Lentisphaerae bacterium]|nr:30S ribosomal protein S3 [Lentisphaerota bacterium]
MGQKTNPIGLRIAVDKDWRSRWFSPKKEFGNLLNEDMKIRELVKKRLENAAVAQVRIERYANRVRVNIFTARPGIVIGRKGQDIERIRTELAGITGKEIYIEIQEIRDADTNAQLVAENIAMQMARRVSFRRAMKRSIKLAMDLGVEGIKIRVSGRLGGSELSRVEWYKEGRIPLHTLRANIDYGFAESPTTAGLIGVKVWICKKDEAQAA